MFVVFDLETTGLSEFTCDVIEFAYVMFDGSNNMVKSEQLYFYYKGMSWSDDAYRVHKIPLSFLKKHEDKFRENIIKMYTILNHANVVGHNCMKFDCPFAKTWLMRKGIKNLEFGIIQDTMLSFRPIYKGSRIKLTKLAEVCGVTNEQVNAMLPYWFPGMTESRSHEAAFDVTQTALIALRGIKKNLITFEPLIKGNVDLNSNDVDTMFEEATYETDPDRFIVELEENGHKSYHFVNHDYSKYVNAIPTDNDIETMIVRNKLFPIPLTKVSESCFEVSHSGVLYKLEISEDKDIFTVSTEYYSVDDTKLSISKIIENNF